MKKVLIIVSSPRENGNSDRLCRQFAKGAEETGNKVETIYLRDKKLISVKAVVFVVQLTDVFKTMIWQKYLIR